MPKDGNKLGSAKAQTKSADDDSFSFGRIKMAGEDVVGGGRDKKKKYREQPEKLLEKIEEKKKRLEELGGEQVSSGHSTSGDSEVTVR